jgi:ATP-binding cassette subfamily B protein
MKKKSKKKSKINLEEYKVILKYAKEDKIKILIACLGLFILNTSSVFTGYFIGSSTEEITKGHLKMSLLFLLCYAAVEICSNVGSSVASFFLNKYQIKISRKIGYDTYVKTMALPAIAFEKKTSGEIINRVTNDTESILGLFQQIIYFLSRFVGAIVIYIYILFNSWEIALEIFVIMFIFYFILKNYRKENKIVKKKTKESFDKFTNITVESIRGVREIRTLGVIDNLTRNVRKIISNLLDSSLKNNYVQKKFDVEASFIMLLLEVGSFVLSAILLYYGKVTLTFFIAMTYYIYRFMYLLESVSDIVKTLEDVSVSLGRVNEILNNKLYKDVEYGIREIPDVKGYIKFDNVSFHYPKEANTLENFSVEFKPNMKIAIVGASGGGKTTIFNLLTRIFDPIKGKITLDGVNISNLTETCLRKNISIIRQEPFIFNRTILENFKMIDDNISLDEVRHYCKLASIDDYIMSLPKKYDTLLGEGGVNLSGGQKQRIAIARTLLKRSKVILFDEATSALDNQTQDIVKDTISELAHDHTIIIIAHRLETIKDADIIYVIDKGKVIASGTHKSLIKNSKEYKALYQEKKVKND